MARKTRSSTNKDAAKKAAAAKRAATAKKAAAAACNRRRLTQPRGVLAAAAAEAQLAKKDDELSKGSMEDNPCPLQRCNFTSGEFTCLVPPDTSFTRLESPTQVAAKPASC